MTLPLNYPDSATFILSKENEYGDKRVDKLSEVPVIFIQATGFNRANFQDGITADAVCYPDFTNSFIVDNSNRLEGMYIIAPLFDGDPDEAWYKVESCAVNRDHLLNNQIDNVELRLKKTRPWPLVS
jgi:hypothetical protein